LFVGGEGVNAKQPCARASLSSCEVNGKRFLDGEGKGFQRNEEFATRRIFSAISGYLAEKCSSSDLSSLSASDSLFSISTTLLCSLALELFSLWSIPFKTVGLKGLGENNMV
jgi:hypothetical protein